MLQKAWKVPHKFTYERHQTSDEAAFDLFSDGFAPALNFDLSHMVQSDGSLCQSGSADLSPPTRHSVWCPSGPLSSTLE